ncbi:MAG: class I SAM-dependent methyltransferase [Streptosporangiales bacterium]|nr:class I SAM-dependent methyltransferase [Streptosporangiales bacterium]
MEGFDPATSFGPDVAGSYDDAARGDEAECVAFLAELAGGCAALEFAVGTGRIALPLAEQGVRVDGIELSPDMVDQLRAKPGGAGLRVALGDMSTASMTPRGYGVVYLVFNTIFNLLTQDDQVRCFENAARHLADDGAFVVEAAVPHAWVSRPSHVHAEHVGTDRVLLDVARYDPVSQHFERNHVELSNAGVRMEPIVLRLAGPSELDLMARIAGLRLADRWGGWRREPFTAASGKHVSVYVQA